MARKIRICHITTGHAAFDNRVFHKQCKTLAGADCFEVTLVARHDCDMTAGRVRILRLSKSRGLFWKLTVTVTEAFLKALRLRADVYHFHDPEFIIAGLLLKALTGGRIIYDVHEDYEKQTRFRDDMARWLARVAAFVFNRLEKAASGFFDGIITATDDILQNFSFHKRAVCIKNYPVTSYFKGGGKKKDINAAFNSVYIGGIARERGLFEMVQSVAMAGRGAGFKLTLFGRFESEGCRRQFEAARGREKVELAGWAPHDDVAGLLGRFDAGLVCLHSKPNFITSLPVKLFEYMAAGLPVVASDFPLWRQIVEGNGCGICVNPVDPAALAKALEFLAANRELARDMGLRGRKAVFEKYSWEAEKKKLLDFYSELLACCGKQEAGGAERAVI